MGTLYYLYNFFVVLHLFQNKVFVEKTIIKNN